MLTWVILGWILTSLDLLGWILASWYILGRILVSWAGFWSSGASRAGFSILVPLELDSCLLVPPTPQMMSSQAQGRGVNGNSGKYWIGDGIY